MSGESEWAVKLLERGGRGADPAGSSACSMFHVLLLLRSVACSGNVRAGTQQPPCTARMEDCPYTHRAERAEIGPGHTRTARPPTDVMSACFSLREREKFGGLARESLLRLPLPSPLGYLLAEQRREGGPRHGGATDGRSPSPQ